MRATCLRLKLGLKGYDQLGRTVMTLPGVSCADRQAGRELMDCLRLPWFTRNRPGRLRVHGAGGASNLWQADLDRSLVVRLPIPLLESGRAVSGGLLGAAMVSVYRDQHL